jgi:eukaryotic translation initiation factor 2C
MEPGEKDVATIQMEDAIVNEAARNRQKESLGLPIRPGYGNKGTSIQVWANSYRIDTNPEVSITRYNVEIAPEVNDKKKKRVFELLRELPEFSRCATEFKSLLVARQPLNIPNPHQVEVAWRAEDVDEPLTGEALTKARKFTVRIITPISLAVSELVKYLGASGPEFQNKLEVIQGLNALFGYIPNSSKNVSSIKGNRHYPLDHGPGQFADLRGGLEALRGYFLSVRPATGCLLLNVNVSHGVFLQAGILADIYRNLGSADLQGLSKKLRHVRVAVTHLPQKRSKKTNEILMRQKTITSFAHPNDGSTEPHPPRVARFGAGPKEVQFWLDDAGPPTDAKSSKKPAGKSKAGSSSGLPSNAYISVFDYFASSEFNLDAAKISTDIFQSILQSN